MPSTIIAGQIDQVAVGRLDQIIEQLDRIDGRFDQVNTTHIVKLSTDLSTACDECHYSVGRDIGRDVDHYVTEHGYRILHVGQETVDGGDHGHCQATVVVLGVEDRTNFDRVAAERETRREQMMRGARGS